MKVLASWLREFANPDVNNNELAHTLTMSGLEVDGVEKVAPYFSKVVVGEVIACEKHPNADKLNLCQVNIGNDTLQIICGASNVRANLKVAVATVGAILPGDFKIKKAKLRGVESNGMICSESEIGLADKSEGIMELDKNAPIGVDIREYLKLDDEIIDIDITPNRGDCFSMLGVARETSVNYDTALTTTSIPNIDITSQAIINTKVLTPKHCPKYLVRVIENIDNTKPTPKWMVDKLVRSGFATHSAIVDITNFVLLELGQPMHSFDLAKINGDISVRLASQGENLTLLNEDKVELDEKTLIIADNNSALAIAGVMGGMASSTSESTTAIVLESAFFDNVLIAGCARSYGLHTESSLRFERGVDFSLAERAIERATQLVLEICGGNAGEVISQISKENLPTRDEISVSFAKINQVLGFELDQDWIIKKFEALDFIISKVDAENISIIPPSFRFDINIDVDLIEELARIYGYDKLPTKTLKLNSHLKPQVIDKYDILNNLLAVGYNEVINYSFISDELADIFGGSVALLNPISSDLKIMRTSLVATLMKTVLHNKRYGKNNLKIFEVGLCFEGEDKNSQVEKVAGLITGKTTYNHLTKDREFDFYDIKADLETILPNFELGVSENKILQQGQRADIIVENEVVGIIGGLNPLISNKLGIDKCFVFELNLAPLLRANRLKYKKFTNYQASKRDISVLIAKKYSYQDIVDAIYDLKQEYLTQVDLLDVWLDETMDETEHSLTFSFNYQADDKTLTDGEIDTSVSKIVELLITKFNAQQR
jgi:phenylalanyl-tRNA synthetase beta chain